MGPEGLVDVLVVEQIQHRLLPLCHQQREKEEVKRHHFEDKELLGYVNASFARGAILEAALARGGQGEAHKDSDHKKKKMKGESEDK